MKVNILNIVKFFAIWQLKYFIKGKNIDDLAY